MLATQALARELDGAKILVVSICPGVIPSTNLAQHNPKSVRWVLECRGAYSYVESLTTPELDSLKLQIKSCRKSISDTPVHC